MRLEAFDLPAGRCDRNSSLMRNVGNRELDASTGEEDPEDHFFGWGLALTSDMGRRGETHGKDRPRPQLA